MKHSLVYWLIRFPVGEITSSIAHFLFIFPTICIYNFVYDERISMRFCIFASILIGSVDNCYVYFKKLYKEIKED